MRPPARVLAGLVLFGLALVPYAGHSESAQPRQPHLPVGPNPVGIVAGDVNGDGKTDLMVANYGGYAPPYTGSAAVLLGNGDGTFAPAMDWPTGDASWSIAAGDLNHDGTLDLAVANYAADDNALSSVSVLLGNGDGTFQAATNYEAGISPSFVAIADLDGDGNQDLAVANWNSASVSVLRGSGNGTFPSKTDYLVGQVPKWLAIRDFNGDSRLDLAVANYGDTTISVLLGGAAGFEPKVDYSVGYYPTAVVAEDLNGDGIPDLAVSRPWNGLLVFAGVGDGTFRQSFVIPGAYAWGLVGVDVDRDGMTDLVGADPSNTAIVLLNRGGRFVTRTYCVGSEAMSVAPADYDGDGKMDLAVACNGTIPGYVAVLLGHGGGMFFGGPCSRPSGPPTPLLELRPNPTRGSFRVAFALAESGPVEISVFDLQGRRVATVPTRFYAGGAYHEEAFNGPTWAANGQSGVFFVRLTTREGVTLSKLIVLK